MRKILRRLLKLLAYTGAAADVAQSSRTRTMAQMMTCLTSGEELQFAGKLPAEAARR